ncbi:MAG: TetR/AcrR family transcriptional regulator [Caldilineae bacterium]|nr:MAG: TetR/AcrR family transcriptional regulator [Caldilineae bacterium]
MPKPTFFNLPAEKQEQIFRAAVAEFAAHPYAAAAINRIVARAGIAKGSFYQYFHDKKDLFLYCLQRIGEEKMAYLAPVLQRAQALSFFDLLQELFVQGVRFVQDHPAYGAIGRRLVVERHPDLDAALREVSAQGEVFYRDRLEQAVARGEIRDDVDLALLAFLLNRLSGLLVEYHLERAGGAYDEQMLATAGQFIRLLRTGMEARPDAERRAASYPSPHPSQGEAP